MSPTISPRDPEQEKETFLSPADRLVADLPRPYYKLSDVAKILNKSPATIRRLMRGKKVKAPSYKIEQGGMLVYLFTPEDIEEIRAYYGSQTPQKR